MVESQPSKLLVAGSIPVPRSRVEPFSGVTAVGRKNPERSLRGTVEVFEQESVEYDNDVQAPIKVEKEQGCQAASGGRAGVPAREGREVPEADGSQGQFAFGISTGAGAADSGRCRRHAGLDATRAVRIAPVSDQAQMREFYLSKLETVDQALRHKFKKLYQYY